MQSSIFLIGFMGSGKSFLGKELAKSLSIDFIDLDHSFVEQNGLSINEFFEQFGETAFREQESILLKNTDIKKKQVVSTGGGTPCFFDNMEWMNFNGTTIFLNASADLLVQRLDKEKMHRPLLKSLSYSQLGEFIEKKIEERLAFYNQAKYIINFEQNNEHTVLEKLIQIAQK